MTEPPLTEVGDDFPERGTVRRAAVGMGLYAGAFAMSYGALSVSSGLSVGQTMALSLVMFSGASQLAFVGVATTGGSPLAAVATALLLGVRNSFYGVTVAQLLHPRGLRRLVTAHLVIDESTAMAVGQSRPRAARYAFWATGVMIFGLWQVGSLAGALLGTAIDPSALGLDAATPAVFLALLWPRLKNGRARVVAGAGALLALVLVPVVPAGVPVIAAAVVAVVGGLLPGRSSA